MSVLSVSARPLGQDDPSTLLPDTTERRSIGGNESHVYQFDARAGHYLRIDIGRSTAHVTFSISGRDGRQLASWDCRRCDSLSLSFIAAETSRYRLTVTSKEAREVRGRYDVTLLENRPATRADRRRVAAGRSFAEGNALLARWEAPATRLATVKYGSARLNWRLAGDRLGQARALRAMGQAYQVLGSPKEAQASFEEALLLAGSDARLGAGAAMGSSQTYLVQGNVQKAMARATESLGLSRSVRDQASEAMALICIGDVNNDMGDRSKSLSSYEEAVTAAREAEAPALQALALLDLGYAAYDLGFEARARGLFAESLKSFRLLGDLKGEASSLAALGLMFSASGDNQQALTFFDKAARIVKGRGEPAREAPIYAGLGHAYESLGEPGTALQNLVKSLALWKAAKYPRGEAETLTQLARLYQQTGDIGRARRCILQAAQRIRTADDPVQRSFMAINLAPVYWELGRRDEALAEYESALKASRACKSHWIQGQALNGIGDIHYFRGDRPAAVRFYEQALEITREHEDSFGEVTTLVNIARAERDAGALPLARARLDEARAKIEKLREDVANENLRASYFATVRNAYDLTIDVLAMLDKQQPDAGHAAAAFEVSESARARSFLDTLMEARVDVRPGADPALLEEERDLLARIAGQEEKLSRLYTSNSPLESSLAVERELQGLLDRHKAVTAQMQHRFADRIRSKPLTLVDSQRLFDDSTLLLEYAVGEKRSFLWAVTSFDVRTYELPGRTILEAAARRFYASLTSGTPEAQLESEAMQLGNLLLGPVAGLLAGKRIVIVPDGALSYVPFGALSIPVSNTTNGRGAGSSYKPLVVEHEISYLPSASSLALLRQAAARRARAPRVLAVFADPVFSKAGLGPLPTGSSRASRRNAAGLRELRAAMSRAGLRVAGLSRLPSSRAEAESIIATAGDAGVLRALGVDASLATLNSADLSQYRVIHFATHGLLDSARPEMSGLVLSLVDAKGKSQNGFLRLHDIYNLDLRAELVVLSACETALGKEIRGEGLVSLTRAFMHAGAARVMASLWKIDDAATAQLMKRFYGKMLREGKRPAAALREAQLEMWHERQWQSPFYWASFVLQGELD